MQYARRDPDRGTASKAVTMDGFTRRRFDLLASILTLPSQSWRVHYKNGIACNFLLLHLPSSGRSGRVVRPDRNITACVRQQRPHYPRHLVGQGDGGHLDATALGELACPAQEFVGLVAGTSQGTACSMDEHGAQIGVAALGNAV